MKPKDQIAQTYVFYVVGDGRRVFCGTFSHLKFEGALKMARQQCKSLTLPGWELECDTPGAHYKDRFPAVQFTDGGKKSYG